MKLYHYSEKKLTEISTRLHRGDVTPKEKAEGSKPLSLESVKKYTNALTGGLRLMANRNEYRVLRTLFLFFLFICFCH